MLQLNNVCKTYKSNSGVQVDALKNVSFCLSKKGMTFILGKSGSGKSTLLNLLGGLDKPICGTVSAFVFPVLSALIPLNRISKLQPIDAIWHI